MNYNANDIETLNFRDAIRTRIEMYMGCLLYTSDAADD